jgi:hypothetical protein
VSEFDMFANGLAEVNGLANSRADGSGLIDPAW